MIKIGNAFYALLSRKCASLGCPRKATVWGYDRMMKRQFLCVEHARTTAGGAQ
jgi:hypothetical protein